MEQNEKESQKMHFALTILTEKCSPVTIARTNTAIDILKQLKLDEDSLIVACLYIPFAHHHISQQDVRTHFSNDILQMLIVLDQLHKIQYNNESEEAENVRKMYFAVTKDIRIIFIKLAYVLAEMRNEKYLTSEELRTKARVNLDLFAPLAARLGASTIKSELEDRSFRVLHPLKYREIQKAVDEKYVAATDLIARITQNLRDILTSLSIHGEIMGRKKHVYSIYKKIVSKHDSIDDIYDLVALRVLVDDLTQCYSVLGKVQEMFTPMTGRFKDYIAMPKSNGYQSLHTTILYEKLPVEIQIRTFDMHRSAEFGYAAHWMYKEKRTKQDSLDTKLGWIRQILEENENLTNQEMIETLKVDIYEGEIFVQSPLGKVVHLPEGATPIDFAYSIHSEVGNKMSGVKINGKMQPITSMLHNGDVVEIITSSHSKGPSRDWLKLVKTVGAKNKIRQFFKREMKDENIRIGKSMLENAFKNHNLTLADFVDGEDFKHLLIRSSFNDLTELCASIGSGSTSALSVVTYISQQQKRREKAKKKLVDKMSSQKNERAVIVEGADNMLVKFANCCSPIPNDEIIGYVSRGQGLVVHRKNCKHVQYYDSNRLLEVAWKNNDNTTFETSICVVLKNKDNTISKISQEILQMNIPLSSLLVEGGGRTLTIITIVVKVTGQAQLRTLIDNLQLVEGVEEVYRK